MVSEVDVVVELGLGADAVHMSVISEAGVYGESDLGDEAVHILTMNSEIIPM